jgi:pilus assembly protein CpaB
MRPKSLVLLMLALGCGLVASIGISQVMQRNADQGPAEETGPVWVAMADIKSGDQLSPQNLKLEQWPKEKIPPGALGKLEDVDGKRTRANLYQGEAVLDKKLAGHDSSVGDLVPKGFRLYTVLADPVNSQGGLLHPSDRVDVLVYVNKSFGTIETGTKTILQDIRVFAVNDQIRTADDKVNESIAAKTVTLLVTPSQAEKVALAGEIGKIRLVMRSPDDDTPVDPTGIRLSDLFITDKTDRGAENLDHPLVTGSKGSGITSALDQMQHAQQPAGTQPVAAEQTFTMQLIKGTEVSQTEFSRKFDDDSRWDNGSVGSSPSGDSKSSGTSGSPNNDPSQKDAAKKKNPASKKDGQKPDDSKSNDEATKPSHS